MCFQKARERGATSGREPQLLLPAGPPRLPRVSSSPFPRPVQVDSGRLSRPSWRPQLLLPPLSCALSRRGPLRPEGTGGSSELFCSAWNSRPPLRGDFGHPLSTTGVAQLEDTVGSEKDKLQKIDSDPIYVYKRKSKTGKRREGPLPNQ